MIRKLSKKQLLKRSILTNQWIRAPQMRVVGEEGELLGVMSREDALKAAQERGVDLIEIAPKAEPPVAKIIDFNKYLYLLSKRDKGEKKGKSENKEIKIGLFMAENDVNRLAKRAGEFLKDGHQVKISLWLKGREMGKQDLARKLMKDFASKIEQAKPTGEPVLQGKVMRQVLSYDKSKNEKSQKPQT